MGSNKHRKNTKKSVVNKPEAKKKIENKKATSSSENEKTKVMKIDIKKDKKGKKKKHKKLKIVLLSLLAVFIVVVVAAIAFIMAVIKTDKWAITREQLLSDAGATVYDKNGQVIATLTGDEINKKVPLSEMGKFPDAFVAIEDERFYEHNGVDVKRTLAAIFSFVTHAGNSSFGGSTITQQLVKITMKDDEQSGIAGIQRKIREWSRAIQVEEMLNDKNLILERYLNRIFLGSATNGLEVRGVESAANYYFNKPAKELTIAQTSFIAGINHAPNAYNPFGEQDIGEKIKTRTLNVIGKMHDLGKVNDEEYKAAVDETNAGLQFNKGDVSNGSNNLSFHTTAAINQIAQELSDKNDISYDEAREMLINSGYKIYTTVDSSVQEKLEAVFKDDSYIFKGSYVKDSSKDSNGQSAMVIVEPSTGYVVAECGALGSNQNSLGLNRGVSKRQAGSSFKPLVTIAPGLENKVITASTLFYDVQTTFKGGYTVHNDSGEYHNITDMRTILTRSLNVPEIKLLSIMGTDKSIEFLKKINIEADPSAGLSMALGTIDVSPLQMAAGYAMLANGGKYIEPTFYTTVVDKDGNEVIKSEQQSTQAMTPENAYIEASLLQGPVRSGTAAAYSGYISNMDVAGKTGTTERGIDRWFCGFTPYYAAACWYGNDQNNASFYNSWHSGRSANPAMHVWFNSMKSVHQDLEARTFTRPEGIVTRQVCKATGRLATDGCTDTYAEIFSKDNLPPVCEGHDSLKICKETGLLATEYCKDVEDRVYTAIIDTERGATWSPKQEAEEAPTDKCPKHTEETSKVDVPNVVGKSESDATAILKKAGFAVKTEYDEVANPKGIVKKQSETKAAKGKTITITLDGKVKEKPKTNTVTNTTATNTVTNTTTNTVTNKPATNTVTNKPTTNTVTNKPATNTVAPKK